MEATPNAAPRAKSSHRAAFALGLCATVAALCVPTAAQATGTHTTGTITANAGSMRSTTNTDSGYATSLAGLAFQKADWTSNPATASWSALCTTGASGACTSGSVNNGRYLVREAPTGAPAGWHALTEVAWGGGSTGASPTRQYVGDVTVAGANAAVHPSTQWAPTAASSTSGAFVVAKDNPPLPDRCGLDVLLLLDRSGSIAAQKSTYRTAARQFVSSLSGTPTRLKISSFASDVSADQASFLDLQSAGDVATANSKIDGVYSAPEGSTNWDGGMNLASRAGVDVVVFITDGNPTYRDTSTGGTSGDVVDLLDLTAGVVSANNVKSVGKGGAGATILAVGAGSGVTAGNLAAVSGPIAGQDYVTSSVAGLPAKLQEIASKLCGTPGINVVKTGNAWAYHGDTLKFNFSVTNDGDLPLTNVTVSDDRCQPVTSKAKRNAGGQTDTTPLVLDVTDTWTYECTMTAPTHTKGEANPIVNTVTATGKDAQDRVVSDTDQHSTLLLHPAIAIDKTGPATALAGSKVLYTLVVTNPGDVYFLAPNVNVTDALCEAPPMLTTKNGDGSPGQLDPGDAWTYTCSVQTISGQTLVDNMGVVSGTDSYGGHVVTARDPAVTTLSSAPIKPPPPPIKPPLPPPPPVPPTEPPVITAQSDSPQQQVLPVALVASGTARLTGPNRCVSGPFVARVTGRGIAKVVFMLDGKKIKTLNAKGASTVFKVQIKPHGRSSKVHRVTALVSFKASANTSARTLRFAYLGCARHASAPQFTG